MGKVRQEYLKQVEILHPHMKEAEEADKIFHHEWKKGEAELGWEKYKQTDRYEVTLTRFRSVTDNLRNMAEEAMKGAPARETGAVIFLLAYLSYQGRFFNSGYTKARIARALKKVALDEGEKALLREILLGSFSWAGGEFKVLRTWIPRLLTPEFHARVREQSRSEDLKTRRRAEQVIKLYIAS